MRDLEVSKQLLPNGVRVILAPRAEARAVTILVTAETGSKYETAAENGLSHFLEHMCFKGTKKYRRPSDLFAAFDSLGAHYNAFTSHESTGYYASVAPAQTSAALELLGEMYLRPSFPEGEIAKERGVVIEEINMYEDLPHRLVGELFMSLVYGNTPVGRPIIGSKGTVQSFGRAALVDYHASHYVAPATIVTVAGNFKAAPLLRQIKNLFSEANRGPKPSKPMVIEQQAVPGFIHRLKSSDQSHFVLGWRGVAINDSRHYAAEVLAAILGGGMSSRLFRRIRDELGAAYYVRATNNAYTDHGVLEIAVGADNRRVLEVVQVALEECTKLCHKLVPSSELDRIKQCCIALID
jgi:predicted Zn-dependent peptidase